MSSASFGRTDVVLRDFDGSETIVSSQEPLPEVIHTESDTEAGFMITHHYLKTSETDAEGRPVYVESNL